MATHYTNALPSATLPDLTTNSFRTFQTNTEPEAEPLPVLNKEEVCQRLLGGCGNTDSTWSCGCRESVNGLRSQVDDTDTILLLYVKEAQTQIQTYHLDIFVGGLLIGVHLPKIGWMMLSYASTFPVLIAFQHPDLFIQLYKKKPEYSLLLVSGLIVCQAYAIYCLSSLF